VHVQDPGGVRPGDVVQTVVSYAAPHHLVADGPVHSHRRTRAGDVWAAGQADPSPAAAAGSGVLLGLPRLGAPSAARTAAGAAPLSVTVPAV
jgi:tRNA-2-methylthio-N6-dimethylallyladenosine synthase